MLQTRSKSKQDKKRELDFFEKYIDTYSDYDLLEDTTYDWILERVGLATKGETCRILDLGCGTGVWSERLAAFGHSVYAIDISLKMVQVAAKRKKTKECPFLSMVGDIEALPFKAGSFNMCFSGCVLHHFPSVSAVLAEIKRVMKQGGRVCLVEPNGSNPVMRLSYLLRVVLDPFIRSSGRHASINEQTYTAGFYKKQCGHYWQKLQVIPFYVEMPPDPLHTGWFLVAISIRRMIMKALRRVLPARYGCNFVIIIGE